MSHLALLAVPVEPSSSPPSPLTSASSSSYTIRDPHVLPIFSKDSVPKRPILYLPPLLSSLPHDHPDHDHDHDDLGGQGTAVHTTTRLPDIDPASLSLHKSLHGFSPATEHYADAPYADAFNWGDLELPEDEEREWYCVAFRSIRKTGSETGPLYDADRLAHEEAVHNGGLILYWYGTPDPATGLNLATCIWQSRAHAVAANARPHHIKAMRLAAASYERYDLERYRLVKPRGQRGVTVEPYLGGEVGW
ncbi:hypothetical protein OF83DRAFT_1148272 [Amylostereum chailletii]|nr:hypothetical protein OF83DRAFT_1148272 [Amylostereum chailletii]